MRRVSSREAAAIGLVLLIVGLAAALSVDVVKTGFGIKADEATYVSSGLSAAFDGDLTYERRDVERFFGLYRAGPEGIFLKRGKLLRVHLDGSPPFVHLDKRPDPREDRLYFAKALLYGVVAAPFVRVLGLNGFLVLHVLLLFAAGACGYAFLAAQSRPGPALAFTLAFIFASCVPVYTVFLAPEILHFSLVLCAYFLWLYKEVSPEGGGVLRGRASDVCAAVLLGAATYSKPTHALLIAPLVLWSWWRRQWIAGFLTGAVCVLVAGGLFGMTALNSGEFNYQGGDRKAFYATFPFDGSPDAWNARGVEMTTNDSDAGNVLVDFTHRFALNVKYFLVGRHFGFVPYFFPGAIAVLLWLLSPERARPWRLLTFIAVVASAAALLVFAPFTWSGGGGPPGNRYFMSVYAAMFFLTPPLASAWWPLVAWTGGALFTAKMLVNPFVAARFPNQTTERGFARRLPVELTMANDLPIMLEGVRAHAWFSDVLMYFLDEHAYSPETVDAQGHQGVWIAGGGRADILVRCEWPIDHLAMTARSQVPTVFTVSMGGAAVQVRLEPNKPQTVDVAASGVRDVRSYAYLLSAQSTGGFTPHLLDPGSDDKRNLGVLVTFTAVPLASVPRQTPP
ncbi:MAG TPA: hypothetical protein VGY48_07925 [Vicinamibacterales bacterium]|jgi:hypothetical protein|nr:hypothetical protein [Vicinamibacterales bacterium]